MTCHNQCDKEFVGVHNDGVLMKDDNGKVNNIPWENVDNEFGLTDHGYTLIQFQTFLRSFKE